MTATTLKTEKKLKLNITYNGTTLPFTYNPRQAAQALYQHAFRKFRVPESEREALALYLPDNTTEVDPNVSLEQAGVQPNTTLLLRPRRAGGGG